MLHFFLKGLFSYLEKQSPEKCRNLGEGFGSLLWKIGYRKKVILKNLDIAFPEKPLNWKFEIGKKSFENIGRIFFEWPKLPEYVETGYINEVFKIVEGKELLETGTKGKVLISAHLGNWEMAGTGLSSIHGDSIVSLAFRFKNKKLNDLITKYRELSGKKIIFHDQPLKDFIKALNEGKILTFLADQNTLRHRGVFVDFFGLPASTVIFPAKLALKYNKDVLFGYAYFDEKEKIYKGVLKKVEFEKTGNLNQDIKNLVQAYTKEIENAVRKHPDQYYWVHKRWKTRPEGEPENIYD